MRNQPFKKFLARDFVRMVQHPGHNNHITKSHKNMEKTMRRTFYFAAIASIVLASAFGQASPVGAMSTTFDFDNAPVNSSVSGLTLTVGGLTASFSATGSGGFAIWSANVYGFTPAGFSGYSIWPSSVYAADLHVTFSQPLTDFSIMYAPEEYGSDNSAIMRITAYLNGAYVGTNTTTAPNPGTWPTGTLTFNSLLTFDNVVVHWDSANGATDYGPIFAADNMIVTPSAVPLPAALPLFATGLGAMGLLGWRRKRKAAAIAA
jgi:hypothetical protein